MKHVGEFKVSTGMVVDNYHGDKKRMVVITVADDSQVDAAEVAAKNERSFGRLAAVHYKGGRQ